MNLGIFALVGVIMLVLASASFGYLLQVNNKSRSSWMLLWFFLCVVLSSIATILTNTGTIWAWAFAPAQDALLILGGVFLVRFAYSYPADDQASESRLLVGIFTLTALAAIGYAFTFAIRFLSSLPVQIEENHTFYLITPLAIAILVLIFFRRSLHISYEELRSKSGQTMPARTSMKMLFIPQGRPALALRNFGLALAISLMPAVVTVSKGSLPAVLASFLFNFGVVAAIAAIMLVYLNNAPEPTTISAKLIGISLITVMLILGLAGVWFVLNTPQEQVHATVLAFIVLGLFSSIWIIALYPLFFRSTLLNPLTRLLNGIRAANEGKLDTTVEVQYEDEIGYLTQSFNRMLGSLNEATYELKNESTRLKRLVAERTAELSQSNQQLISENIERKEAQTILKRQLRYEQALANCSRALLLAAEGEERQQTVLTQALEHLRIGAQVSRAYIFRNIQDPEMGLCMGILAEACAPDILPHLENPANRKFPWSQLPQEMLNTLQAGEAFGGPVQKTFANAPFLLEAFLRQANPLLSMQCFPIFFENLWWGFVGFDDCESARDWEQGEVLMLHTASEMIGNTMQRWQAEDHLRETLDTLEERVRERTIEFAQANAELKHEIFERQRFQEELEERLDIERTLANISSRLLSPIDLNSAIYETLVNLGQIMQAERVVFIHLPAEGIAKPRELIEWHAPDISPITDDLESHLNSAYPWLRSQIDGKQTIYIKDTSTIPVDAFQERQLLAERGISSLLLTPLFMDNQLEGVISIRNPKLPKAKTVENIRFLDVVAGMLSGLVRREALLNTLEEKVAERTQELSAFFDMAMLAGEAHEISDIMQPALVKIMEIITSEASLIHLYDDDQGVMKLVAQRGFSGEQMIQLQTIQLDESMVAWIHSSDDIWSPGPAELPDAFELPRYQSVSHVPLRARGKIQGLLSCYRQTEIPFNPYQVFFLNAIGEQLGMAVENYRLRLKTEQVATIQERQRLARELHDAVSQSLYSLTLFAHSGRDAYEDGDQAKLLESLEQVEANSQIALKEMRLLLYQLRSLALEEGGLKQAIESRFQLVEHRLGIQASVHMEEDCQLKAQVEQELFRLVTEALNNALKHARASQVTVNIGSDNGQLVLVVWDNGQGFNPSQDTAGMGLQNMRERISALDGRIEISSHPGQGTRVRVEIPQQYVAAGEG